MYRINVVDEETLKKNCSDTDRETILKELQIYIPSIIQDNLSFEMGYYRLINRKIWFSGDNLITRKQMYRRINKKKIPEVENDHDFASYIILPFIKGNRYSGVNTLRASTGGYDDNPFVFFEVLKELFLCGFSLDCDTCDAVKKAIILTKDYWDLFGKGEDGWECYRKTFGLICLEDLKEKDYEKYFTGNSSLYEWKEYITLLNLFKKKRIEELSSNN